MSDETKIINAHDRIWLQVGEDFLPGDIDFNELSDVTWCQDKQGEFDVEYLPFIHETLKKFPSLTASRLYAMVYAVMYLLRTATERTRLRHMGYQSGHPDGQRSRTSHRRGIVARLRARDYRGRRS